MGATEIIKTRITPETKARVAEVTQAQLLTESIWLRRLVLKELRAAQSEGGRWQQVGSACRSGWCDNALIAVHRVLACTSG